MALINFQKMYVNVFVLYVNSDCFQNRLTILLFVRAERTIYGVAIGKTKKIYIKIVVLENNTHQCQLS